MKTIRPLLLLLSALLVSPRAAAQCSPGPHAGTITADQTWCAADSPHVLTGVVTVAPGVTLTIEAGSTVKPAAITVQGHLAAAGTAASPITFTSDGPGWESLTFSGGTGLLRYVDVLRAGWNAPGIVVTSVAAPGVAFEHCNLGPGNKGLAITNGVVSITDSRLEAFASGTGTYPVVVSGTASRLTLSNDTFLGNWANEVVIEGGALTGSDITLTPQPGLLCYRFPGDYEVPAGRTVTLAAGTVVHADWTFTVKGRLVALGMAASPVAFASGRGTWIGLVFDGGTGQLAHTSIAQADNRGVTVRNAGPDGVLLDHCTIGPASGAGGLVVEDSVVTATSTAFTGITATGAYPVVVRGAASRLSLSGTSFAGNWANEVVLEPAAMTGADFTLTPQAGLAAYRLGDDYTIPAGRTLTVAAGVTLRQSWTTFVNGRFETLGTPSSPVVLTNGRWDYFGNPTWIGVTVDGGTALLRHTTIEHADALRAVNQGTLRLERSRTRKVRSVRAETATLVLANAVVADASVGLDVDLGSSLTAAHVTLARFTDGERIAARVRNGSTATFTNSIVASSPTGVVADGTSTVTMRNTLWDSVATPTAGPVTQEGHVTGSASFAPDGFHLEPASAALAQGVATSVADDIDGEPRPRPATMLPDLGADESEAGGLIAGRTATAIGVGETKSARALAGSFSDHVLALSAGEVPVLRVRVAAAGGTAAFRLLVRSRQFPLATLFDVEGEAVGPTAREVVVAAPAPGDWYLGVLSSAGDVPFTISVAGADRGVASITPSSGGNTGPVTVRVDGAGFEEGATVELRNGGVTILSTSPSSLTSTQLAARLVLTGLAPQACDACVVWPDATTHCVPGGFRIAPGVAPDVDAHLSIPAVLRGGRGTTAVLSWENRGNVDAEAPLFVVASDQSLPMRRDGREGWRRGALRFLGIDKASFGSAGVLPPSARGRVTFEIFSEGPAHAPASFTLRQLSAAALSRAIDWAALEPSLRPEGIDPAAWSRVFPLVTGAAGSTWGEYVGALRANASYLSGLGRHVADPEALFGVTVQRALETSPQQSLASGVDALCPAPGPVLSFGRSFANGPFGRATVGALGVGWTHTYDKVLATLSSGDREIRSNDGSTRLFRLLPDGTFRGLPGDHGRLVVSGATARLVERNGVALAFRADGRLGSISDATGNRLDVTWDATGRLSRVAHTSGDVLSFDHDSSGRLVRLTDHAGQVTTYAYDGAGRRLVQVTQPGGRVTRYAYLGSGPDADALVSIEFPDGSHVFYEYDGSGRLVGNRRDTLPATSFSRDAAGRIVQAHGAAPRGTLAALAPP
ncbi:MAG: hypothetical protein KJ062_06300 [Thermoanaerobaculia bacterium]|nr:hypothetical protein [Thermoanaerobaculia bacterium]